MIVKKLQDFGGSVVRFAVNDVPARLIMQIIEKVWGDWSYDRQSSS